MEDFYNFSRMNAKAAGRSHADKCSRVRFNNQSPLRLSYSSADSSHLFPIPFPPTRFYFYNIEL